VREGVPEARVGTVERLINVVEMVDVTEIWRSEIEDLAD